MRLKTLELVGFKSFAQKTTLDFQSGITSIVGPNGSGKSNIIDAIRWLLGEREAKNIRGAKAEDLIFAGTQQRPRMGLAQATISFDNSDHFFPLDYTEISVSRKISRDGDSEYFINEAPVRLRDIIDFFAKARLGARGLTIVNQGNSDIFVRATPKERRTMIEEVLGLRQYQLKKHEAERKLINTKFNLEKVKAMTDELLPHLRLLRRQASKYEKQADLQKELEQLEREYFGGKLAEIEIDLKELEPSIRKVDELKSLRVDELKNLQAELQKVEKSLPTGRQAAESKEQLQTFLNKKSVLQKEVGRTEAQIEFLISQPKSEVKTAEAIKILEETKAGLEKALAENDLSAIKALLHVIVEKVERVLSVGTEDRSGKIKDLEKQKSKLLADLQSADEELAKLAALEGQLADELRGFNAVFKKAFEVVEAKKDEIQKLENEKNKLLFDKERINIRRQELENLAMQTGRRLSEFEKAIRPSPGQFPQNFAEIEKRMFKLRAELAGIGDLDPALIKEAQEIESRYNFLSGQMSDLEKATEDLLALIKDLDEKIHNEFNSALKAINEEFDKYFKLMFGGGKAHLKLIKEEPREKLTEDEVVEEPVEEVKDEDAEHGVDHGGLEVTVSIPRKKISGLEMLSGGERSLVSIAALFALISVSPPPFLVLDEVDAALDESNAKRFADLISDFSKKTQFIIVTHNRATMEAADVLYGVTMRDDGTSRILSLKFEEAAAAKQ